MIQRRQDWRTRLVQLADEQEDLPFEWGKTDCASIARAALVAMFGEAVEPLLPRWSNGREAVIALKEHGSVGKVLEDLGAVKVKRGFMRSGDIIVSAEPREEVGREAVMVCIDGSRCLASTHEGVSRSEAPQNCTVYSLWEVRDGEG